MWRIVLAALALTAACGNDDGGGSIPIDGLANALFNEICNGYAACGVVDDVATCRKLFEDDAVDADLIAAVKAGKVVYHSDKAGQCLSEFANGCDRNDFLGSRSRSAACDETFTGTVGDGGQCAIDEECISQDCNVP